MTSKSNNKKVPVSESEFRVLKKAESIGWKGPSSIEEASRLLKEPRSSLESIFRLLRDKGLARVRERTRLKPVLTERGLEALEKGLPEEHLIRLLGRAGGALSLREVKERLGKLAGVAIGQAVKSGLIRVSEGRVELVKPLEEALNHVEKLRDVLKAIQRGESIEPPQEVVKRGLVRLEREKETIVELVSEPSVLLGKVSLEVARLTHELLKSGGWRGVVLRSYNIKAEPPKVYPARIHFLTEFIEMLRDIMKEMGFKEAKGPLVEAELFNFDLLFQPQDHPAREIHDTLRVEQKYSLPGISREPELLNRVAEVHRRGWGYEWDPRISLRLVLRSQTTAVSARVLVQRPRPPIRVFTIGRVFRSDVVDATHLPEFHQLDGIEGDYDYTFRDLLGTLQEISSRLGFRVKFKPAYFPFTEPSVEGYVQLPNGRWIELFGAGMMRPEVLEMAGVDYPVGAWGFGIERLAAAYYGLPDIRLLYTRDLRRIWESKKR
ncbi:MAG: phenylalanine--tRNA ligase subunit alpha [Desulfurococcales archaeon]|nr:phenylalanine--tRNA ligase subunit alpha [Desulfurococcales archaeon]